MQNYDQVDVQMLDQIKTAIDAFDPNQRVQQQLDQTKARIHCLAIPSLQSDAIAYWLEKTPWSTLSEEVKTARVDLIIKTVALVDDTKSRDSLIGLLRSKPYRDLFPIKDKIVSRVSSLRKTKATESQQEKQDQLIESLAVSEDVGLRPGLLVEDAIRLDPSFDPEKKKGYISMTRPPWAFSGYAAYTPHDIEMIIKDTTDMLFGEVDRFGCAYKYRGYPVIFTDKGCKHSKLINQQTVRPLINNLAWGDFVAKKDADGDKIPVLIPKIRPGREFCIDLCESLYFLQEIPVLDRLLFGSYVVKKLGKVQLILEEGYDEHTKIRILKPRWIAGLEDDKNKLALPPSLVNRSKLEGRITKAEARAALDDLLTHGFKDCPFVSQIDKIHAVAATLSFKLQPYLGNRQWVPMFFIEAPKGGQGKSTLTNMIIALGTCQTEDVAQTTLKFESDWNKPGEVSDYQLEVSLSKRLMGSIVAIVLDNTKEGVTIKSTLLERMIDQQADLRILQVSDTTNYGTDECPRLIIFLNGNKITLGDQLPRRTVVMHLAKNFNFPKNSRKSPVSFLLEPDTAIRHQTNLAIILQYWIQEGMHKKEIPLGYNGSREWYATIGGILECILDQEELKGFGLVGEQDLDPKEEAFKEFFEYILENHKAIELEFNSTNQLVLEPEDATGELLKGRCWLSAHEDILDVVMTVDADDESRDRLFDEFTGAKDPVDRRRYWQRNLKAKVNTDVLEKDDRKYFLREVKSSDLNVKVIPKKSRVGYILVVAKQDDDDAGPSSTPTEPKVPAPAEPNPGVARRKRADDAVNAQQSRTDDQDLDKTGNNDNQSVEETEQEILDHVEEEHKREERLAMKES